MRSTTVHTVVRGIGRTYVQTVYVEDILYPTWLHSQLYTQDYLPGKETLMDRRYIIILLTVITAVSFRHRTQRRQASGLWFLTMVLDRR